MLKNHRLKFKIDSFFFSICCIPVIISSFSDTSLEKIIRIAIFVICGIFILLKSKQLKYFISVKYFLIIFLFIIAVVSSSFCSKDSRSLLRSFSFCGAFLELIIISGYYVYKNGMNKFFSVLLKLYLAVIVFVDVFVLYTVLKNGALISENFLLGNKFSVTYLNIQFIIVLWCYLRGKNKRIKMIFLFLMMLFLVFLAYLTRCTTSIIAGIILLICFLGEVGLSKILLNPYFSAALFILSALFIFWYVKLLDLSFLRSIFHFFNENLSNLSGRVLVYQVLPKVCSEHFFLGYGHGTAYELLTNVCNTADAQNGFMQLMVCYGIIGSVLFAIILWIPYFGRIDKKKVAYPIFSYLFIQILIAFIEIPYDTSLLFFSYIAILFSLNRDGHNKKYCNPLI